MADWVDIADSAVDPDAPLTSELAYAWRDNIIAMAEGSPGAPRIQSMAHDITATLASSTLVLPTQSYALSTAGATRYGGILFLSAGTVKLNSGAITGGTGALATLYLNGAVVSSATVGVGFYTVLPVTRLDRFSFGTNSAGTSLPNVSWTTDLPIISAVPYAA